MPGSSNFLWRACRACATGARAQYRGAADAPRAQNPWNMSCAYRRERLEVTSFRKSPVSSHGSHRAIMSAIHVNYM